MARKRAEGLAAPEASGRRTGVPSGQAERDGKIDALFGEGGLFGLTIPGFHPRLAQAEMAKAISGAISSHGTLVAEAGTGTGKTFAYLVPALIWGGKVILSTGSKTLQDQLYLRDIPAVRSVLGLPVTVSLLKGRSSYVCLHHLEGHLADGRSASREDLHDLAEIARFAKSAQSGDRSELKSIPETAAAWTKATSTRENCLGSECRYVNSCFVMKARKKALEADIVVVNHHLFFADLVLRDTGVSEILPSANTVIFDEAHQLPDTATLFFGETWSTFQLAELCMKIRTEGLVHARDGADWMWLTQTVLQALDRLRAAVPADIPRTALHQLPMRRAFDEAMLMLDDAFLNLMSAVERQAERAESLATCASLSQTQLDRMAEWTLAASDDESDVAMGESVLWIEASPGGIQLHSTPLSVAPMFNREREDTRRAWIFTSATLSVAGDFTHYATQLGLHGARCLSWPSPFDYPNQGLLYVPGGLPEPASPDYSDAVLDAAQPVIEAARGRTFFLCTTLRAVDRIAQQLKKRLAGAAEPFTILAQGDMSRTALLERFRTLPNAVLVASQSFWEGVDVKGKQLSLVIIDKLPFAPPDDPVMAARLQTLQQAGRSPFLQYQLPEAIISLKQGAGRLVRDENDRGVLMICDPRLISKGYGRRIWQSLPPFRRTRSLADVRAFLAD